MKKEGSLAIEAAKLRLAAAKRQLAFAANEVKEAEAYLSEMEKRFEVINVDVDSPKKGVSISKNENKKRRISTSPGTSGNENSDARGVTSSRSQTAAAAAPQAS